MVELIVVMILIGILGAIGAGRFFSRSGFDAASFAEQGTAMLRYGQKLAIAQNRPVYVQLLGSAGAVHALALCYSAGSPCAAADRVPAPGGANSESAATRANCAVSGAFARGWYCEGVPAGSTLRLAAGSPAVFYFNGLGRPYLAADTGQASTFAAFALTVAGDQLSRTIAVSAETGYVF